MLPRCNSTFSFANPSQERRCRLFCALLRELHDEHATLLSTSITDLLVPYIDYCRQSLEAQALVMCYTIRVTAWSQQQVQRTNSMSSTFKERCQTHRRNCYWHQSGCCIACKNQHTCTSIYMIILNGLSHLRSGKDHTK